MTILRFCSVALSLGLAATILRAQSVQQRITFNVTGTDIRTFATNQLGDDTDIVRIAHRNIYITKNNLVKAIALDVEGGPAWTNWRGAKLLRRINLETTNQAMFLSLNGRETNVSRFFFTSNFTSGFFSGAPTNLTTIITNLAGTNAETMGFTLTNPVSSMLVTNVAGVPTGTNYIASFGLTSFSVATTNLSINLIGANLGAFENGFVDTVDTVGTNTSGPLELPSAIYSVIGTVYVNLTTNPFTTNQAENLSNAVFVTGPVTGNMTIWRPVNSTISAP